MRGVNEIVPRAVMLALPQVFHDPANARALRMPDYQPGPRLVVDGKQVELAPQRSVVAPAGFFQPLQMRVQRALRLERRPVDALQHRAILVPAPVRARHVQQLEGGNRAGGFDVRSGAEVFETAVRIGGNRLVFRYVGDDLKLERLIRVHPIDPLPRVFGILESVIARDDRLHPLLDFRQILRRERVFHQKIVVKAIVGGRSHAELGVREHGRHHIRHDMRGGVPNASSQLADFGGWIDGHFRSLSLR